MREFNGSNFGSFEAKFIVSDFLSFVFLILLFFPVAFFLLQKALLDYMFRI